MWETRNLPPMSRSETLKKNAVAAAMLGFQSGPPPTGYRIGEFGSPPVADLAVAPHIIQAFRLRREGASLSRIAAYLDASGVPTRSGKPFSRQAAHAILRNPFYFGKVRLKGKEYPGAHERMAGVDASA